ncbi:hypothetical protein WJX74_009611 [Apatococcus lobatus]|uniref:Uncharacterized protein n=1 Tax=Apatococcus lobatus TaxID=904363 RepID=A0AAW1S458_9CHLO
MNLDFPEGSQGLGWIVGHGPLQLLLIPGLTAASIAAAAAGDTDALNYLRFAAQHFAALGSTQNITALDRLCIEACSLEDYNELGSSRRWQPGHVAIPSPTNPASPMGQHRLQISCASG